MGNTYTEHAAKLAAQRAVQLEKAQQIANLAADRDAQAAQHMTFASADYGGKADPGTGAQRPTEGSQVTTPELSTITNPEGNQ